MNKTLKATLTAVLLSSVAVVPAATISVLVTADAAHAKSENAGGNGNGNGGGGNGGNGNGGGGGKGKSSDAKTKSSSSKSGTQTTSRGNGNAGKTVTKLFQKLTGQERKASRTTSSAKAAAASKKLDPMHPSNLGKMNGALNANVNALIAHVKNGNTNGPIGGMAALAVAGYAAQGADAVLELEGKFVALDDLLIANNYVDAEGNPDLAAYLEAIQDTPGNGEITSIEDALASGDDTLIADALLGSNNGVQDFASIEEYETWRDGVEGAPEIVEIDTLALELDGLERPTEEEVDFANEVIGDRTAAEDYMLSIWNKGDGDDTVRSPAEDQLLTALYDRIEADGATLTDAIEEYADLPEPPAPAPVTCDAADPTCEPTEEVVAVTE